jgi:transposase
MEQYGRLDVLQKETAICVIDSAAAKLWEGTCRSTPEAIAGHPAEATTDYDAGRDGDGTAGGVALARPEAVGGAVRNDAHGLPQIVRAGWYRAVEMKSLDSHELRTMLQARQRLIGMRTTLYNQVRGLPKTFGVVLRIGRGSRFLELVGPRVSQPPALHLAVEALLSAWREVHKQIASLVRASSGRQGTGKSAGVAFHTTIDAPTRFRRSKDVGPYLGLTPSRYQSGEVDHTGGISQCGTG